MTCWPLRGYSQTPCTAPVASPPFESSAWIFTPPKFDFHSPSAWLGSIACAGGALVVAYCGLAAGALVCEVPEAAVTTTAADTIRIRAMFPSCIWLRVYGWGC